MVYSIFNDIMYLPFTVFPCKFNSPKVKRNLISSIINFANELPHELSNNLKQRKISILSGDKLMYSLSFIIHFQAIMVKTYVEILQLDDD